MLGALCWFTCMYARLAQAEETDECNIAAGVTVSAISGSLSTVVNGCYNRSNRYKSLGRGIYTNDDGAVQNGSTIAIFGSSVSSVLGTRVRLLPGTSALRKWFILFRQTKACVLYSEAWRSAPCRCV